MELFTVYLINHNMTTFIVGARLPRPYIIETVLLNGRGDPAPTRDL